MTQTQPKLILASQSKARKALLESLGIAFTVQPAHIDESELKNETPLAYVKRIAITKAKAVSEANPGCVVLAADTPVIVGRRILQTPQNAAEATEMIRLQSSRRVTIPTVVAVADTTGKIHTKTVESWIKFKRFSEQEIADYISTNKWQRISGAMDDATLGHWFVKMSGSATGITGLPLYETSVLLTRAGLTPKPFTQAGEKAA